MLLKSISLIYLCAIVVISSQGIFYLTGAASGLRKIPLYAFAEQRRKLDPILQKRYKAFYYAALLSGLILLVLLWKSFSPFNFISVLFSTICTLADIIIALKVSMPVNRFFVNTSDDKLEQQPHLQKHWLNTMLLRGFLSSAALIIFLNFCVVNF